ncbi:M protein [Helicobacter pylori]|uniref:M protein n=1 Tax=Helicobacter pylori TaxID=210 RepID=UPI00387E200E
MDSFFRKSSNDTQENSKDAQGKEKALKGVKEENNKLNREKTELTEKNTELQKQVNALKNSQQVLENEKAELLREKENLTKANTELKAENEKLTKDLSNAKNQVNQAKEEKDKLEQKYAPYKKLERLYEVFLEVKGCLNFGFVEKTHSAMDLIASVLIDSKYYLESLYNKAFQELSDKRSDKGEKLAELFDLLFEYVKDNKFERLKEPSAYDSTCKKLYPEQNTSQKIQRVVLIGYTYDKKTTYYTIVDMGS